MKILIDGSPNDAREGERLIDVIGRAGVELPHVCYHPQLGPISNVRYVPGGSRKGELVRACSTPVSQDISVRTTTTRAQSARTEAFDRILTNHLLYCTVCDNNNGNCTVHNTTKMLGVEHQSIPFKTKPYEVDYTNPFYRDATESPVNVFNRQPHRPGDAHPCLQRDSSQDAGAEQKGREPAAPN